MDISRFKYSLCLAIVFVNCVCHAQTNDATSPTNFPNPSNPTKLMPTSGDSISNGGTFNPPTDQADVILVDTNRVNAKGNVNSNRTKEKRTK